MSTDDVLLLFASPPSGIKLRGGYSGYIVRILSEMPPISALSYRPKLEDLLLTDQIKTNVIKQVSLKSVVEWCN